MPKKAVQIEPVKRRLNVELPINLHNRFKAACAKHDRKMVDVVLELITRRTEELEVGHKSTNRNMHVGTN